MLLGDHRLTAVVLSRATEARDRRLQHLRVEGMRECLLVSQHAALVERYSRHGDEWVRCQYGTGDSIALETGHTLEVDALYADVFAVEGE